MILENPHRSPLCDSPREEMASALTHGLGILVGAVGLGVMIWNSDGDILKIIASLVFGFSLILLYSISTLYHLTTLPQRKSFFQKLDHAGIYLLIAGSYTPITLITLRGVAGWTLFGIVWVLAIVGMVIKLFWKKNKPHWISTTLYLAMGWLILFALKPLNQVMPSHGVSLLVAGGFSYSFGIIFYAWNRLLFNHALWHLFVLGGSICHLLAVIFYVI